ncbi:hypothetical protein BGZ60DRAFT_404743 [Tricladium varicosporioides]|nr:hypothetical protein BGZ60DRAFT_404743 [Hymenoscyphus varicosporioides]
MKGSRVDSETQIFWAVFCCEKQARKQERKGNCIYLSVVALMTFTINRISEISTIDLQKYLEVLGGSQPEVRYINTSHLPHRCVYYHVTCPRSHHNTGPTKESKMVLLLLIGAAALGGRKAYTSHKKHRARKLALKNGTAVSGTKTRGSSRRITSQDQPMVIHESQLQNGGVDYHDLNEDENLSGDALPPPAYVKDVRDGEVMVVVPKSEQAERHEQVGLPVSYLESMSSRMGGGEVLIAGSGEAVVDPGEDVRLRVVDVDEILPVEESREERGNSKELVWNEERGVWEEAVPVLCESPVEMEEYVPTIPRRSSKRNSKEVRGLSL